ncbi:MAG: AAA family ATPase, partial [Mesorhizobium sp.]
MTDSLDALNKKLDRLIDAVSRLAPPPVPET